MQFVTPHHTTPHLTPTHPPAHPHTHPPNSPTRKKTYQTPQKSQTIKQKQFTFVNGSVFQCGGCSFPRTYEFTIKAYYGQDKIKYKLIPEKLNKKRVKTVQNLLRLPLISGLNIILFESISNLFFSNKI